MTAAAIAIMANASVTAEAIAEPQQLTDIDGYMCYEKDGWHWTVLDGVEYLVIGLDDLVTTDAEDEDSFYSTQSTDSPIGLPTSDWYDCGYVNIVEKKSYTDGCYISTGNCDSKIYYCPNLSTNKSHVSTISTKQIFNNEYKVHIYLHNSNKGEWEPKINKTLTFNILTPIHMLYTSDASQIMDGFAIRFLKEGSTGEKTFYYTIDLDFK